MIDFVQRTLDGLLVAGPYALVGLGLTISFGVLRRINLAYGATAMLAAYAGAWLYSRAGWPAAGVFAVVVLGTALAGLYVSWLCFPPARGNAEVAAGRSGPAAGTDGREVVALAASFALWMQLEQLSVSLLPRHLNPFPAFAVTGEWALGPWFVRGDRLAQAALAVIAALAVHASLKGSRAGLAWRATSDQPLAAQLGGLDTGRVQRSAVVATGLLAGFAACAVLALEGQVTPMFGMWMLVKGLVAAMIGGLGSVRGVLWGAAVLGVVEAHAQALFGAIARDATAWALLLAVLVWRGSRAGAHGALGTLAPPGEARHA